jgi:hypothetical protein
MAPLDERLDRRRPERQKFRKTKIFMPSVGFEIDIPLSKRPQNIGSEQLEMKKQNAVSVLTVDNRCEFYVEKAHVYVDYTLLH